MALLSASNCAVSSVTVDVDVEAAAAAAAAAAASSESESEIKAPRSTRRQTRGANVRKSKFITGKTYDNESGSETENTFTEAPTPTSPRKRINSESTMKKASSSAHEGPKKEFKQFANGEIAASLLPVRRDLDDLEPMERRKCPITGKSLSEALLFAEHGENMLCTKIVLNVRNNFCTQHVLPMFELGIFMYSTCNSMNNLSSYCGLVDAKIRASDKDLPVQKNLILMKKMSKK